MGRRAGGGRGWWGLALHAKPLGGCASAPGMEQARGSGWAGAISRLCSISYCIAGQRWFRYNPPNALIPRNGCVVTRKGHVMGA